MNDDEQSVVVSEDSNESTLHEVVVSPKKKGKKEKTKSFDKYWEDTAWVRKHVGFIPKKQLKYLRSAAYKEELAGSAPGEKASAYAKSQKKFEEKLAELDKGIYCGDIEEEIKEKQKGKVLIWVSFAVNIILTVAKCVALILSGSIAVLASFLDSCLDLLSGSIVFVASRMQKTKEGDHYKYPVGKRRLETLSVIVFAAAMFTATGQVLIQAVQTLTDISKQKLEIDYVTIGILSGTIVAKAILFLVCRSHDSVAVRALAQDHRNDVISNSFGMATALIGFYFWKYTDPIGGLLMSLLLMYNWAKTGYDQVKKMTGLTADPEFLSILTYIAFTHDKRIEAVDTVRAYFTSNSYIVEVDIILPEKMRLKEAHDIGESLQIKLEQLPEVERAFVHLDYEYEHSHHDEHPSLRPLKPLDEDETDKTEGDSKKRGEKGKNESNVSTKVSKILD